MLFFMRAISPKEMLTVLVFTAAFLHLQTLTAAGVIPSTERTGELLHNDEINKIARLSNVLEQPHGKQKENRPQSVHDQPQDLNHPDQKVTLLPPHHVDNKQDASKGFISTERKGLMAKFKEIRERLIIQREQLNHVAGIEEKDKIKLEDMKPADRKIVAVLELVFFLRIIALFCLKFKKVLSIV